MTVTQAHTASPKRIRTCIGCGAQQGKLQLLRIVRTDDGPQLDLSGRMAGRGAYVCSARCLDTARKGNKLARALKTTVKDDDYERLAIQLEQAVQTQGKE